MRVVLQIKELYILFITLLIFSALPTLILIFLFHFIRKYSNKFLNLPKKIECPFYGCFIGHVLRSATVILTILTFIAPLVLSINTIKYRPEYNEAKSRLMSDYRDPYNENSLDFGEFPNVPSRALKTRLFSKYKEEKETPDDQFGNKNIIYDNRMFAHSFRYKNLKKKKYLGYENLRRGFNRIFGNKYGYKKLKEFEKGNKEYSRHEAKDKIRCNKELEKYRYLSKESNIHFCFNVSIIIVLFVVIGEFLISIEKFKELYCNNMYHNKLLRFLRNINYILIEQQIFKH